MDYLSGLNTSTRQRLPRPPSPPSEVWDNDEDFDLTSLKGNALELPRSVAGSEGNDEGNMDDDDNDNDNDNEIANVRTKGERDDWEGDFADEDDEDNVDTLKVSQLAAETLAQLALLKKPQTGDAIQKGGLTGLVTMLGTHAAKPIAVDMEAGGDWDEDLEVPDTFPGLRLSEHASSFASDLEFETPSLGSTSDAATSASANSEMRGKGAYAREAHSSTSSVSSAFTSPSKSRVRDSQTFDKDNVDQEEEDFDLPGQLMTLQLGQSIGRVRSSASLDQQTLLWEDNDKRSVESRHKADAGSSFSEASVKESDADGSSEGIEMPDQIFAKLKGEAPSVATILQAKLQSRKRANLQTARKDGPDTGGDVDFSQGLVITEDMDLSVNRLKAKRNNNRMRETAHQRKIARQFHSTASLDKLAGSNDSLEKNVAAAGALGQVSTSSRLLASTKASRAREAIPRSESPRPSESLESVQWNRSNRSSTQVSLGSSHSMRLARQGQLQDGTDRNTSNDRPLTPSITSSRGGAARYSMPTAASRARQIDVSRASTSSPLGSPAVTRLMRGPKRPRVYGDGKELEAFDDLPVHREKETAQLQAKAVQTSTKSDLNKTVNKSRGKLGPKSTSVRSAAGSSSSLSKQIKDTPDQSRSRRSKRHQPTLIRNLGGPNAAPRVEGSEMKWNPVLRRWEGNDEEGRSFEKEVRGRGRPALITRLAVGKRAEYTPSKSISSPPPAEARIVGDMIFDPIRLCWLNKNKEDEVDPFAGMDEDSDDDQHNGSSLKVKSLSASLGQRSDGPKTSVDSSQWSVFAINKVLRGPKRQEVPNLLADRIPAALWKDSIAAKTRHDDEMAPFLPSKQRSTLTQSSKKPPLSRDRNSHLYLIRTLARKASSSGQE